MSRLRPRFSLLTALLLTTIVRFGIVVALLWREVGPLRAEVRNLRNETGQLTVDDADQIYVVALQPNALAASGTWKWRVYLPEGSKFNICAVVAPKDTQSVLPSPSEHDEVLPVEPGEHILQISFRDEPNSSHQYLRYLQEGVGKSSGLRYENQRQIALSWPKQLPGYVRGFGYSGALADSQRHFAAKEKVLLLRLFPEFMPDKQSNQDASAADRQRNGAKPPTNSFYLWIEQRPSTSAKPK